MTVCFAFITKNATDAAALLRRPAEREEDLERARHGVAAHPPSRSSAVVQITPRVARALHVFRDSRCRSRCAHHGGRAAEYLASGCTPQPQRPAPGFFVVWPGSSGAAAAGRPSATPTRGVGWYHRRFVAVGCWRRESIIGKNGQSCMVHAPSEPSAE